MKDFSEGATSFRWPIPGKGEIWVSKQLSIIGMNHDGYRLMVQLAVANGRALFFKNTSHRVETTRSTKYPCTSPSNS